jgi:alpha-L-fucosidase
MKIIVYLLMLVFNTCLLAQNRYQPDWESLKKHTDPEWFRDAKLGIYTHWGPVTVGCEDCPRTTGQWYGGQMYQPQNPAFNFHKERFGDQTKVGYKDIIPLFKAEKFNANEWADLFVRAGAKFAGPVAVHHDNFAMWDSKVTPWNAAKMGPKRDITGELEKAIKSRGMKFITTFHHGYAWRYYQAAFKYDAADPKYSKLYTEPHDNSAPPSQAFLDQWLAMVNEAVSKYKPDMIWFDFELWQVIPDEYRKKMFADYYNWADRYHLESAVAHKHTQIHQYTGILDFERGREDKLVPYPWLTDTSVGPWFNNKATPFRTADNLIDVFVDIVSKNGCMLLNVGPAADGTIPDQAKTLLLDLGDWLKVNGEAIYGSRPWKMFGEGPVQAEAKGGGFSERNDKPFSSKDIRFTTRGEVLYAIALDWPEDGILKIQSLGDEQDTKTIKSVQLLGYKGELSFSRDHESLKVIMPESKPCKYAFTLKITK